MASINNNRVLEAFASAIEKINISPEHRYIHVRTANYNFPNWYIYFDLFPDETHFNDNAETTKHIINMRSLPKTNKSSSNFYVPIAGIDEALALAHFSLSNHKNVSTAQLFSVGSYASHSYNLWYLRYQCMTDDEQWIMIKLKIDVNSGAILHLHKEPLAQKAR